MLLRRCDTHMPLRHEINQMKVTKENGNGENNNNVKIVWQYQYEYMEYEYTNTPWQIVMMKHRSDFKRKTKNIHNVYNVKSRSK